MIKYVAGIDPGYAGGAIALLPVSLDNGKLTQTKDPIIFHDIEKPPEGIAWHSPLINFFKLYKESLLYTALELVNPSFNQGVVSAGHFKGAAMVLETLVALTGTPYELVTPVVWQRKLVFSYQKESVSIEQTPSERQKIRQNNKKVLKKAIFCWAKVKYPRAGIKNFSQHSNRADALGIAEHAFNEGKAFYAHYYAQQKPPYRDAPALSAETQPLRNGHGTSKRYHE